MAFPPSNEPSEGEKAAFPPLERRWKLISFKWTLRRLVRALVSLVGSFRAAIGCQNGAARARPASPGSGRALLQPEDAEKPPERGIRRRVGGYRDSSMLLGWHLFRLHLFGAVRSVFAVEGESISKTTSGRRPSSSHAIHVLRS